MVEKETLHFEILNLLRKHKQIKISFVYLAQALKPAPDLAALKRSLSFFESQKLLIPIQAQGTIFRGEYEFYSQWRIQKRALDISDKFEAVKQGYDFLAQLNLEPYKSNPAFSFEKDRDTLEKVNSFMSRYGEQIGEMYLPQISWLMVGNEKWIEFEGGKKVLEDLGLWGSFSHLQSSMPLPFSLGAALLEKKNKKSLRHLVIENKATWHMLSASNQKIFDTIIFGSGWQITSNLQNLKHQLGPLAQEEGQEEIFYFGDLDWEGLSIWHRLFVDFSIPPYLPLYEAVLRHEAQEGKKNQRMNEPALLAFASFFSPKLQDKMYEILTNGRYIPQESVSAKEIEILMEAREKSHEKY